MGPQGSVHPEQLREEIKVGDADIPPGEGPGPLLLPPWPLPGVPMG